MKRKIDAMHKMFGIAANTCEHCKHLITYDWRDRRYFKCEVYGESNSEATDWRKKYIACGLFNKDTQHHNIYKTLDHTTKSQVVLDGQQQIDIYKL